MCTLPWCRVSPGTWRGFWRRQTDNADDERNSQRRPGLHEAARRVPCGGHIGQDDSSCLTVLQTHVSFELHWMALTLDSFGLCEVGVPPPGPVGCAHPTGDENLGVRHLKSSENVVLRRTAPLQSPLWRRPARRGRSLESSRHCIAGDGFAGEAMFDLNLTGRARDGPPSFVSRLREARSFASGARLGLPVSGPRGSLSQGFRVTSYEKGPPAPEVWM